MDILVLLFAFVKPLHHFEGWILVQAFDILNNGLGDS